MACRDCRACRACGEPTRDLCAQCGGCYECCDCTNLGWFDEDEPDFFDRDELGIDPDEDYDRYEY